MSIWETIASPLIAIVNKVVPDRAAAAAAVAQLKNMAEAGELQTELIQLQAVTSNQTDVNKVEAASHFLFVAGWRPYVGWVAGTGLALQILAPYFTWIATLCGHPVAVPVLDSKLLEGTLSGMLGLGFGLRTYEKKMGITGNH